MTILAIDPGTTHSAWLELWPYGTPTGNRGIVSNAELLQMLRARQQPAMVSVVVLESVESFGMAVGREVFETVFWSGRFVEATPLGVYRLPRRTVKLHLCGSPRAKDANIRQAILDRFGGRDAVGTIKRPGPLHGVRRDLWSALALALTFADAPDLAEPVR